nr:MAG TPA: hypothetical protein [Bacteriophage sp.]
MFSNEAPALYAIDAVFERATAISSVSAYVFAAKFENTSLTRFASVISMLKPRTA